MASGDPTKLPFPIPPSGPVVFAPQPPTHVPSSSTDIINTFTNMKIVMSFAKYLREKYCGLWTSTRDTCLDSQKKFIDKYYLPHLLAQTLKTVPSRETIYNDLSAFVKSRGSNISSEFDQWKQTMEGRAVLLTKGGKRNTRNRVVNGGKNRHLQSLASPPDLKHDINYGSSTANAVEDSHNLLSFSSLTRRRKHVLRKKQRSKSKKQKY